MRARKLFLAGSTGAVGRTLLELAERRGVRGQVVPHLRPRGAHTVNVQPPADAVVCDLADRAALEAGMRGATTVIQLIGTMKKRFASGDTYESSDLGTTVQLMAAARATGVDHVVFLSSVGAGSPTGTYLRVKARAEAAVRESGLDCTIFRPSAFSGAGHHAPMFMSGALRGIGLGKWAPIRVEDLAAAILSTALERAPLGVLEGRSLWDVVRSDRR